MVKVDIELNEQFKKALVVMEHTSSNIFITGKAGTGKSTLLEYFRSITQKRIVVLAPTGVAALNVRGQTIHSFFGFKPDITLEKIKKSNGKRGRIFKEIDAVVIDEVSMVRADLLDCMEKAMRLNGKSPKSPFGGTQMIFIGDLYQLPPVVTGKEKEIFAGHYQSPYFFSAHLFEKGLAMGFVELEKIYRQKDSHFISLLNAIRNNSITDAMLEVLNKRVGATAQKNKGLAVHLTTTNQMASEINTARLRQLKRKVVTCTAEISGDFEKNSYPADQELQATVGSQVMLLNNDPLGRWVNGTMARIEEMTCGKDNTPESIYLRLQDGTKEEVLPYTWELVHYRFNEGTGQIDTDPAGSFRQYPFKLAWAVTIHKSQGKTFDTVHIDMGNGAFAHGQTYVALSRCTSLEGITLTKPIKRSDVRMDWKIVAFLTKYQYALSEQNMPFEEKLKLVKRAIETKSSLAIVYLKASDEKSRRLIRPVSVGQREYQGKSFIGVDAYCMQRKENRMFRLDRMLEIAPG